MFRIFKSLRFRQSIAFLIGVFFILVIVDELSVEAIQQAESPAVERLNTASVDKAKLVDTLPNMQFLATVNPIKLSQINGQVSGKIISLSDDLRQGRSLLKGQHLLTIEPLPYQVALAQAKVGLLNAKVGLKKANIHFAENSLIVTLAEAEFSLAQRQYENAKEQLRQTNITLPFDAEITEVKAYLGEFITPGQAIVAVLPRANKQISILVNEQYFNQLAPLSKGQKVRLFSEDKTQQWQSIITAISQHNNNLQRSVYLKLLDDNKSNANEPLYGQFIYAQLPIKGWGKTASLPESALTLKGEIWWLDEDNKAYKSKLDDYVLAESKIYFPQIKHSATQALLFPLASLRQGMKIQPRLVGESAQAQGRAL